MSCIHGGPVSHKRSSHQENDNCSTLGITTLDLRDTFSCPSRNDRKRLSSVPWQLQLLPLYHFSAFGLRIDTGQRSAKGVRGL